MIPKTRVKKVGGLIICFFVLLFILWFFELYPTSPTTQTPPSWMGIEPGHTHVSEVLTVLEQPDEIKKQGKYLIYVYQERSLPPEAAEWFTIEVVIEEEGGTVKALNFCDRFVRFGSPSTLPQYLGQLVALYQKPEAVKWGAFKGRYLIWADSGVSAAAEANTNWFDWNTNPVSEIMLFEPMSLRRFWRTYKFLPLCGGWNPVNLYSGGDAPDLFPRDPYDWDHMPTPQGTPYE